MDVIIENEKKALNGNDIAKFLDHNYPIYLYKELNDFKTLNEAFKDSDAFVILYLTKKNFGHWCAVIRHKNNIEFFDSYGKKPDTQIEDLPENFRKREGQLFPQLTALFLTQNKPVYYNSTKLQSYSEDKKRNISTCGRHVACRIHYKNIPLNRYVKLIQKGKKKGISPDEAVTYLTLNI